MILKLHAETPFVKGFNRGCIYDLPRGNYELIPIEMIEKIINIIDEKECKINKLLNKDEILWLNFFIQNEYCFYIPDYFKESFPPIDFKWQSPSIITNSFIDIIDLKSKFDFQLLESLGCKHLLIRILGFNFSVNEILFFLKDKLNQITMKSIDLILDEKMKKSSKENKILFKQLFSEIKQLTSIRFNEPKINIKTFIPQFIININTFSESKDYNTYFNRKLYIDSFGNIKNGIENENSVGKVSLKMSSDNFLKKIKSLQFRKSWSTNKDKIDVCKDCEFRYMCIDNRIPNERIDKTFFFDLECSYNPYISKWSNEQDFYSLEEVGVISNKNGFSINLELIKEFNETIWKNA